MQASRAYKHALLCDAGDLHFYMRHSFKAAPPAEAIPPKSSHPTASKQARARQNGHAHRQTAHPSSGNGMNGHHHHPNGDSSATSWKAVTEEALKKLQTNGFADMKTAFGSPAMSSASFTGLSRSASFASLDSQGNYYENGQKGNYPCTTKVVCIQITGTSSR